MTSSSPTTDQDEQPKIVRQLSELYSSLFSYYQQNSNESSQTPDTLGPDWALPQFDLKLRKSLLSFLSPAV